MNRAAKANEDGEWFVSTPRDRCGVNSRLSTGADIGQYWDAMQTENPLGYSDPTSRGWGRKPRECLPCKARELYIEELAAKRLAKISIRIKNRYIDEFLRYTQSEFGHTDPKKVDSGQILSFAKHLLAVRSQKESSLKSKLRELIAWFCWMHKANLVKTNPASELTPNALLEHAGE